MGRRARGPKEHTFERRLRTGTRSTADEWNECFYRFVTFRLSADKVPTESRQNSSHAVTFPLLPCPAALSKWSLLWRRRAPSRR
jgi:hypothetical protein